MTVKINTFGIAMVLSILAVGLLLIWTNIDYEILYKLGATFFIGLLGSLVFSNMETPPNN